MINARAMGIIFPNLHDENVPELVGARALASIPFAGRYRMIDFCLSGMTMAGIQNIGVVVKKNYQSLMDHLGTGREWDLSTKRGGLVLFPPYSRDGVETYSGRIEGLASILDYLGSRREELVVMCDCDMAYSLNFTALLAEHRTSGADVTLLYRTAPLAEGLEKDNMCLSFDADGFVDEIRINEYKKGVQNLSMNVYVIGREYLVNVVREATVRGDKRFASDFLARNLKVAKVRGYEYKGYCAHVYNMQSYFKENIRLLDNENLQALFPTEWPVYTKVRDEAPVRYAIGCDVANSIVADGCIIEGDVENCVLFRGVRVGKGARLRNCVVMQGSVIEPGVSMENVVADKNVRVCTGQKLSGAASFPVYLAKGCTVM